MTPFTPIVMAIVFLVIFTKDLNKPKKGDQPEQNDKPRIVVLYDKG